MKDIMLILNSTLLIIVSIILIVDSTQRDTSKSELKNFKTEALQRGFADYNQQTANWEWKTNIVKIMK